MIVRLSLTALLSLSLAGAAEARGVTVTTGNGGSYVRSAGCAQSGGQLNCQGHATGAGGRTTTRDRSTMATAGQISSTLAGTRGNGQGFSRSVVAKH